METIGQRRTKNTECICKDTSYGSCNLCPKRDDLVKRLQNWKGENWANEPDCAIGICKEAAERIEELETALREIVNRLENKCHVADGHFILNLALVTLYRENK